MCHFVPLSACTCCTLPHTHADELQDASESEGELSDDEELESSSGAFLRGDDQDQEAERRGIGQAHDDQHESEAEASDGEASTSDREDEEELQPQLLFNATPEEIERAIHHLQKQHSHNQSAVHALTYGGAGPPWPRVFRKPLKRCVRL